MNFIPEKIFILENNQYKEITFEKFCWLREVDGKMKSDSKNRRKVIVNMV